MMVHVYIHECNALDFCEDFEAGDLTLNGWTTLSGAQSGVSLTTVNAIADTVSLEFTGGSTFEVLNFN